MTRDARRPNPAASSRSPRAIAAALVAVAIAAPIVALGAPIKGAPLGAHQSLGAPNSGKLVGGKRWTDTPSARRPRERPVATGYGMPGLIGLLQNAARKVASQFPRSVLVLGEMSAREGGPLVGHHSHQSGRDADVGFYVTTARGKPVVLERFVAFDAAGHMVGEPHLVFDDRRNWAFVQALLTDGRAQVRSIFIASWLRARLLKEASEARAPKAVVERAAAAMIQPANAEPHHDHFHVRIACPASQHTVCRDDSVETRGGRAPSEADPPGDGDGS